MLWCLWQGREQRDAGGEVADGFQMSRAVAGLLARPPPVDHSLLVAACGGVVLGDELRLGLHKRGELCFEDPSNLLVHLLPGALEQRRIGCLLDQGVFEDVTSARWSTPLV